jgi:Glycosyltransferase family 87
LGHPPAESAESAAGFCHIDGLEPLLGSHRVGHASGAQLQDEIGAAAKSAANRNAALPGRAWLYGAAAGLLLLWVLNWSGVWPLVTNPSQQGSQDFSIFYTGARIVRSGLSSHLYELSVQARYQMPVYQSQPLPFNHPAYELIPFLPLAALSFRSAYLLWAAVNVATLLAATLLLAPRLSNLGRHAALWSFAAGMASFPLIWALCQGQDSILLLLLFVGVYLALKSGKDALAGAVLALGLFKFPLVVPFLIPFLLKGKWRLLAGFAGGTAATAGVSILMTGIAGAHQYVQLLSLLAVHPGLGYINPLVMPDARGFLLTLLAGHGVTRQTFEAIAAIAAVALVLVPSFVPSAEEQSGRFDLWFALNLTVALMASPHLYWHDLSPLLLALLLAANVLAKGGAAPSNLDLGAMIVAFVAFALPWPIYFVSLRLYPSYFFLPLCLFTLWLAVRVLSSPQKRIAEVAPAAPAAC